MIHDYYFSHLFSDWYYQSEGIFIKHFIIRKVSILINFLFLKKIQKTSNHAIVSYIGIYLNNLIEEMKPHERIWISRTSNLEWLSISSVGFHGGRQWLVVARVGNAIDAWRGFRGCLPSHGNLWCTKNERHSVPCVSEGKIVNYLYYYYRV